MGTANLRSISKVCNEARPSGAKAKLFLTCKGELNGMPATREEVVLAAVGTPGPGDSKIYDEPFDFSLAPTGSGYWREIDIRVDSADYQNFLQGADGGKSYRQELPFSLDGATDEENAEFADVLAALSGCMIAMLPAKTGKYLVLGDTENPASLQDGNSALGKGGDDENGWNFILKANLGYAGMNYDAETHGIDVTPNT